MHCHIPEDRNPRRRCYRMFPCSVPLKVKVRNRCTEYNLTEVLLGPLACCVSFKFVLRMCSTNRGAEVSIATFLRAGLSVVRITIGTTDFPFSKAPYHLWAPLSLLSKGYRDYIPGEERSGLEVNDSPLWLRNVEDVSVLPVRAFMVWTGKTLPRASRTLVR